MKKLTASISRKSDHTVAGEFLMEVREILEKEDMSISQRLEALKAGSQALNDRLNLRAEQRRDALVNIQIEEVNRRYQTNLKIESIELAPID